MNKIEKEFVENGKAIVRPGGILLFSKEDALKFIQNCKAESINILGIDGFFLKAETIQPSMENSVDFTSSSYISRNEIYSEAINFLYQHPDNLVFEVVCD